MDQKQGRCGVELDEPTLNKYGVAPGKDACSVLNTDQFLTDHDKGLGVDRTADQDDNLEIDPTKCKNYSWRNPKDELLYPCRNAGLDKDKKPVCGNFGKNGFKGIKCIGRFNGGKRRTKRRRTKRRKTKRRRTKHRRTKHRKIKRGGTKRRRR